MLRFVAEFLWVLTLKQVPVQPNTWDCGVYLLHLTKVFMSAPETFFKHIITVSLNLITTYTTRFYKSPNSRKEPSKAPSARGGGKIMRFRSTGTTSFPGSLNFRMPGKPRRPRKKRRPRSGRARRRKRRSSHPRVRLTSWLWKLPQRGTRRHIRRGDLLQG